jgi:hypothetical protein
MSELNQPDTRPEMQDVFQSIMMEINRYRELQLKIRNTSNTIKPMNACEPIKEPETKKQEGVIGKMREMQVELGKINNDMDDCCRHLYRIIGS